MTDSSASATPAISIVIPVFNRAGMVTEAIDSALAACGSFAGEVLVVDDASTDDTWDRISTHRDLRVRALRMRSNGGQSAARNAGIDAARGGYLKFLDSDDVLLEGHLEAELEALKSSGADVAVSGWRAETPDGVAEWEAPQFTSIVDDVLAGLGVPTSAALYRRREWRWDPALRKLDDWDYFANAALSSEKIVTVPGAAYLMRAHAGVRATGVGMLAHAREHHQVLHKIEKRLEGEGLLTPARRRRLAAYYYKELRVLCLGDSEAFEAAVAHIRTLHPGYAPGEEERQLPMRLIARLIGFRNAILAHTAVKRAVRRTRS